jgi:hypothetical protein
VREKVYLQYARAFLKPEQIDAVDDSAIPGYSGTDLQTDNTQKTQEPLSP